MEQRTDAFRTLKILHLALLGFMTLMAVIAIVLVKLGYTANKGESFDHIMQVVCILVSVIAVVTGFNLFRRKLLQVRNAPVTAEERMDQYRAACIVWWAMIEGPGIFATIGFLLTGNYAFLALAIFHITILAVFMPRKQNIILLLNFNEKETARLEGK